MVTGSRESSVQTEARLRQVFKGCRIEWLHGNWSFVEGPEARQRTDAIAVVRDEERFSALCSAPTSEEQFGVFRVVLQRGIDDSGFIGWLASRIKAETGSGLIVVCGQDKLRGGVFDYYGVPSGVVNEVRKMLARLATSDSLSGAIMRPVSTSEASQISDETVFCFDQDGQQVSARYAGGVISEGWLVGRLEAGRIGFDYMQFLLDGTVQRGRSTGEVTRLPNGRWRLIERYQYLDEAENGVNQLES